MAEWLRFPNAGADSAPGLRGRSLVRGGALNDGLILDKGTAADAVLFEDFFGPPPSGLQAARFDAAADRLTMPSAALPAASGGWTVGGWVRITTDLNVETVFWSLDANFSSGWHGLHTTSDGTGLRFNSSGSEVVTGPNLTVGVWYYVAIRKTAADAIKMYVGTEAGGALSTYTGTASAITSYAGDGYVGSNAYDQNLDGRIWGLRVWDAELTDGEVAAEFAAATAARTTNLRAQWLLDAVPPTADSSGNGRDLTNSGGSWTLEAGPTLPAGSGITVDVGRATVTAATYAPTELKEEDVGRALATSLARAPTTVKAVDVGRATATAATYAPSPLKAEDVGRALVTASTYTPEVRPAIVLVTNRATAPASAYAPTIAKAEDVGRALAATLARAPAVTKTEDVGRSTATATTRAPTIAKIEDVSRALATARTWAPTISKLTDVGRALATSATRAPTVGKAIDVSGRATALAVTYLPTVETSGAIEVFVDVDGRAIAYASGPTPSVDRVLDVARVTVRAIRPLDVIYNRERRGSAGWRSWRRA